MMEPARMRSPYYPEEAIGTGGGSGPKPLPILQVTAADWPTSVGKQIIGQSLQLAEFGIAATVVSFVVGGGEASLLAAAAGKGLATECLECSSPWDPRALTRLRKISRRRRAQVLVTHGYKADVIGLLVARRERIPIVAVAHGWTRESRRVRLYERLDRFALKFVDAVVAVSDATRDTLLGVGMDPGRVVTIRNAVDPQDGPKNASLAGRRLRQTFGLAEEEIVVATAGRLSPEKGQGDFLRACAHVSGRRHDCRFLLFGDGNERARLERLAAELGVEDRVVFCGHRDDFLDLLPGVDLLVLSSLSEGLPVVILEAFAACVPVVATSVGGVPEVAEHGATALVVPPGRPLELAEAVEESLTNRAAARSRAESARRLVIGKYGFADNARRLASLIRDVVTRHSTHITNRRKGMH
jgi:glycosyltransferase involved in cell wall biosynthesis